MTFIEVCGIHFAGETPSAGLLYSNLKGWDGVPEARGGGDAIPGGHGSFERSDVFRESRAVSIVGAIVANSDDEFFAAKRRLEAIPSTGFLCVDQGDGSWNAYVEVDRVSIPDKRWHTFTEVVIDLVAPDPVRYRDAVTLGPVGLPVQVGGLVLPSAFPWNFGSFTRPSVSVANEGSESVLPVVTVTGSASSLVVHGGPRRLSFGAFDGVLVLDCRERRAWLNGGDVTRQLVRRDWFSVPAGESQEFFFEAVGASPDTSLSVEYRIGVW